MTHTTVVIPKVGVVAFPPSMSGQDINTTVRSLHHKAVIKSVLKFVAKDPALAGLDVADFYKQLSGIAAFLEKYQSLARVADAGIHGEKVHDLPTVPEDGPVEQEPSADKPTEEQTEEPQPVTPDAEAEEESK